jgi:hypothetical protein
MFRLPRLLAISTNQLTRQGNLVSISAPLSASYATWIVKSSPVDWRTGDGGSLVRHMSKAVKKKKGSSGGKMAESRPTVDAIVDALE